MVRPSEILCPQEIKQNSTQVKVDLIYFIYQIQHPIMTRGSTFLTEFRIQFYHNQIHIVKTVSKFKYAQQFRRNKLFNCNRKKFIFKRLPNALIIKFKHKLNKN